MSAEWIRVSDRLPEMKPIYRDGPLTSGTVIIFNGFYVSVGKYEETYTTRKARWQGQHGHRSVVTHWMPLPEPPSC